MPLTDLLALVAIVGYLGFNLIAYALLVIERLGEITYRPYKAQAAKDSPEPLPIAMSYMDIALLGLSPDMRAEFLSLDDPQRSSYHCNQCGGTSKFRHPCSNCGAEGLHQVVSRA